MAYVVVYLYAIPSMVDHSWYTTHGIPPTWYTTNGITLMVYLSMVYTLGITRIVYLWWYTWWYTYTIYHPWRAIHDIPLMLYHPRFTSLWYHTRYSTDCIPLMVYLMVYLYAIPPMVDHSWYTTHCIPPTWYTTHGIPPTVYISMVYTRGITNLYTLDGIHGGIPISKPPMVVHSWYTTHGIPSSWYTTHGIPPMVFLSMVYTLGITQIVYLWWYMPLMVYLVVSPYLYHSLSTIHDIPLMVYHPHDIPLMVYHPRFTSLWYTHEV